MKFIIATLIVCLVGCGLPLSARADSALTNEGDSSGDSGGGSEANNVSLTLLVVAVVIVVAVGIGLGHSNSIAKESNSPLSLYASTDRGDAVKFEQGDVTTTGLAFAADF